MPFACESRPRLARTGVWTGTRVIAGGNLWHHRVAILRLRGATPKIWRVTSTCLFKSMRHTSYLRMSTHVYACTTTGENGCLLRIFATYLAIYFDVECHCSAQVYLIYVHDCSTLWYCGQQLRGEFSGYTHVLIPLPCTTGVAVDLHGTDVFCFDDLETAMKLVAGRRRYRKTHETSAVA